MVGEDGKPYQPRGQPSTNSNPKPSNYAVRAIQKNPEEDNDDEPDVVGYVNHIKSYNAPPSISSLNW
jgi:hypothetical protein